MGYTTWINSLTKRIDLSLSLSKCVYQHSVECELVQNTKGAYLVYCWSRTNPKEIKGLISITCLRSTITTKWKGESYGTMNKMKKDSRLKILAAWCCLEASIGYTRLRSPVLEIIPFEHIIPFGDFRASLEGRFLTLFIYFW